MKIDTTNYRRISTRFLSQRKDILYNVNQSTLSRHKLIQNKLKKLSDYFDESATLYEENEIRQNSFFKDGNFRFNHHTNINLPSIVLKGDKKSYLNASMQYSFKEASTAFNNDWIKSNLRLNVGDAKAKVDAEFSLWKDKKFDPKLKAELDADIALASANLGVRLGTKNLYTNVDARGAIGALYADVECVLSKDEQVFETGIGACALKGEATISFNIFGVKVTLTGEGSIGSAEANISYHHKNKEWEFGSKLGFIAGLGFKIRVNY